MRITSFVECNRQHRFLWPVLLAAVLMLQPVAIVQAQEAAKTAQTLLFDAPYLTRLTVPSSLRYSFRHTTSSERQYGKTFEDTIDIDVGPNDNAGGVNSVMLRVFSRDRQRRLGPHLNMTGNPIIMVFLERDLWEMKRRVGGAPVYYRNMIRKAFREAAKVETGKAQFGGELITVHKVTITPFADDKQSQRIQTLLNKSYEFVVADAVPGGILKVRSAVPAEQSDGGLLVEDELAFVSVK